jgi:DHA3 family macrolide efflux protein-like MFS transporter
MKDNKSFFLIWAGQTVSILGSSLSGFALGVWIYQTTGSASQFALVALCTALPQMLVSPFAGVVVDRFNRRKVMAFSDGGAALCTLALAGLFISGQIQVVHIYLLTACSSACNAVQVPTYSALVATLIKREQLGRANGLVQFGRGLAEILAPALAGLLVLTIKVPGILAIDLGTFCFAVFTLIVVRLKGQDRIPQTDISSRSSQRRWQGELRAGWQTLRAQPELALLLRYQLLFSFLWSLFGVLVMPMVLGFSDSKGLGWVLTLAGAGLLSGSLILSAWGGPKHRLTGVLAFELLSALAFCLMGSRPILLLVMIAAFAAHFTLAFVSGCSVSEHVGQMRG